MKSPLARTLTNLPALTALLLAELAFGAVSTDPLQPAPDVRFYGPMVQLPLKRVADRFLVEARIGDAGPYAFVIDTGAGISVLDTAIAEALSLSVVGQLSVGAPGGRQVLSNRVVLPSLTVHGLTIEGLSPVVLEIDAMSSGLIQGVLGMDVFQEYLLTLDPFEQIAVFSRRELQPGDPGVISFDHSQGRMAFDIDVAGRSVPTQIDTGSPSAFTLPLRFRDQLPTDPDSERKRTATLVGGQREITVRTLDGTISFAGLSFDDPEVAFMDPSPPLGNIGGAILNQLIVSIDSPNSLIAFSAPEPGSEAGVTRSAATPRRLGIQFGGGPGRTLSDVGHVDVGSLGAQAGIQAGDTIISLNGRPMGEYGVAELGSTIRSDQALRFVIERDGRQHVIVID